MVQVRYGTGSQGKVIDISVARGTWTLCVSAEQVIHIYIFIDLPE